MTRSPSASFVAMIVRLVLTNSAPAVSFTFPMAVAKKTVDVLTWASGQTHTISSVRLLKLLRLSTGVPLSRSFLAGISRTLIVCIFPVSVKIQILSVFITGNTYRLSAWTAS